MVYKYFSNFYYFFSSSNIIFGSFYFDYTHCFQVALCLFRKVLIWKKHGWEQWTIFHLKNYSLYFLYTCSISPSIWIDHANKWSNIILLFACIPSIYWLWVLYLDLQTFFYSTRSVIYKTYKGQWVLMHVEPWLVQQNFQNTNINKTFV
jgi:hypothetical protein